MRFTFIALLLLSLIPSAHALRVYQSSSMGNADRTINITYSRGEADVAIYRTSVSTDPSPYVWFITKYPEDADVSIFITTPGFAQCKVFFVNNRSEAGLLRQNRGCFR